MPRIKSAKKRVQVAERNRLRNMAFKSAMRTAMKIALTTAKADPQSDARKQTLDKAFGVIDRGVQKGVLHKNTAARYKSRLATAK